MLSDENIEQRNTDDEGYEVNHDCPIPLAKLARGNRFSWRNHRSNANELSYR